MSEYNYLKRAERLIAEQQRIANSKAQECAKALGDSAEGANSAQRAAFYIAKAHGLATAGREVHIATQLASEAQTRHEDETRTALRRALAECESCCLDSEEDREWVLYQLMNALGHGPGESDTKQVILGNGKGQGAFGLGPTFAVAADIARREWRSAIGGKLPKRVRICSRDMGTWETVVDEARFRSWKALNEQAAGLDAA
jgi:hypothetical protein